MAAISNKNGAVIYLSYGALVENFTTIAYHKKRLKLFRFQDINYTVEALLEWEDALNIQLITQSALR